MKLPKLLVSSIIMVIAGIGARAAVVSTTLHGAGAQDFDSSISMNDIIAGQIGVELPPLNGWHPANTVPADQLPALTDGAGLLGSGLTGLLNDFPGAGVPAKTLRYSFGATDIGSVQILTGNNGADGRIFSTSVIRYSVNSGADFNVLGYFQSDPSGTVNSGSFRSTLVSIYDDSSPLLQAGVTDLIFEFYAVDNTAGQMRDPFDGVNPFTGLDDGLTAAFVSPLIWEVDVIAVPEPSIGAFVLLGLAAFWRRKSPK